MSTTDELYKAATEHDLIRQTALAESADHGDRYGSLMQIGFIICDALTLRGEHVPPSLGYRPAPSLEADREQMADDLNNLDAEEAEAKYPDHGDLYFAWGLGLGEGMGSWDADDIRDYLTDYWEPAYEALVAAGEDY